MRISFSLKWRISACLNSRISTSLGRIAGKALNYMNVGFFISLFFTVEGQRRKHAGPVQRRLPGREQGELGPLQSHQVLLQNCRLAIEALKLK